MNSTMLSVDKAKISKLITEMISIMLGSKISYVDSDLVEDYIHYVLSIDKDNPIKDLLLLNQSFIDSYIHLHIGSSSSLADYRPSDIFDII